MDKFTHTSNFTLLASKVYKYKYLQVKYLYLWKQQVQVYFFYFHKKVLASTFYKALASIHHNS